jgi:ferredoxin
MRVWIDQDLCTGDGLCVDHCPDVFVQLEDGIVAARHVGDVIHAAETCPGECIFIEIDMPWSDATDVATDLATDVAADVVEAVDEAAA